MWCHLCQKSFDDPKIFSMHIMKKHRLSSKFDENNSESEQSKHDDNDEIEDDNSDEDFFSADNCSENESKKAVTPRKKRKYTPRNKRGRPNHVTKLESANQQKKLKMLKQISKTLTNYNFLKNQPASQPVLSVSCLNDVEHKIGFDFDSRNILLWLKKFKEMYKKFTLPLKPSLFNKIKMVHQKIFDNYNATQSTEVTSAVLKVYEEMDWLIHRHIISINESL